MNKIIFILLITLLSISVFAQAPANDVCSGATTVTPNGTCVGGTTTGSGDHWVGSVGCAGNNNEVWYSFVATGTSLSINVTNGTQVGNIEFVLVSATGACSGLALVGSACGASPLTNTISGLSAGTTYYYTISSTGANGTFTTCVTNTTPPTTPGQDCPTSTILCSKAAFAVGALANGVGTIFGNASNENLSALGCLAADERQSQWYKFTVSAAGTLEFIINPNVNADDIDWAVYNITTSGCTLTPGGAAAGGATQLTCSFSGCTGSTGITTVADPCATYGAADCGGPPGCQAGGILTTVPNLVAGNTYAMVIDNFSTTNGGFSFNFNNTTAEIGANATFTAAVNASPCMIATVARTPFYTGANMTYLWNFGDGFTSTSGLPGAHTYTATGIYNISLTVTDALGCVDAFSQAVNIGCLLPIELLNFEGYNNDDYNVLNWSTATEKNNDYFKVEKSTDGVTFSAIGEVNGAGNSLQKVNYSFIDKSPKTGINYYRLTQTDFDKRSEMSHVISIENKPSIGMDFYPNPTTDDINIVAFGANDGIAEIRILNLLGEHVSYMKVKNNEINTINLESYNAGIYIVELTGGTKMVRSKLIKR